MGRLRDDVRLLGELVGCVLKEQGGQQLLDAVEYVRRTAIALRSGRADQHDERRLLDWLNGLETGQLVRLTRAFATYFHLINLAEEHHRVRILQQRGQIGKPVDESIEAAVSSLAAQGVPPDRLSETISALELHPVFTAHPSEVRRRSVMYHLAKAGRLLQRLDGLPEPSPARQEVIERLLALVTVLWQTAETRVVSPTPLDETENTLYFIAGSLYDVTPRLLRAVTHATQKDTIPALLRFGSWVGGDRDGNPNVNGEITRTAARLARRRVLDRYIGEVEALGRDLSLSGRLAGAPPDLVKSVERDRKALGLQPVPQWQDEPYRRKLGLIGERLKRTRDGQEGAYRDAREFTMELDLLAVNLRSHDAERVAGAELAELRSRAAVFGFHLAEVEIRQHAQQHTKAVAELLALEGDSGYDAMPPEQQQPLLERRLAGPVHAVPPAAVSAATRQVLDTFLAMADIQRVDPMACHTYVISMCSVAADVLAVLFLARQAGLFWWNGTRATCQLDVVPLFETVNELADSGQIMSSLLASKPYKAALRARGNRQQVMVGYSDSNKDGGYLASMWHTYRGQELIARAVRQAGAEPVIFHGRGGAIGRGGGPAGPAIGTRPPSARLAALKLTEQGEVVFARYANPDIAARHLEQMTSALLTSVLDEADEPPPEWRQAMERLAESSRSRYRRLVERPDFLSFLQQATPFPELARLNVASRPVSRAPGQQLEFQQLRAIPWGFSWSQSRFNLPGWFGLGSALTGETGHAPLQDMYRHWPFFAMVLDNAQISLGTADMATARRYAELAGDSSLFGEISDEFDRTVSAILSITAQSRLIEHSSFLSRSIELRNPYVDALHFAQLTLLRRYRGSPQSTSKQERAGLLDAIHHTINGIAAGLQVTG